MKYYGLLILAIFIISCEKDYDSIHKVSNDYWHFILGGKFKDSAEDIDVDKNGNIYACCVFSGTLKTNNSEIISQGRSDIALLKLNKFGKLQWIKTAGGAGQEECSDIVVDNDGNSFVIGNYDNNASFDNIEVRPSNNTWPNLKELFIAKYNSSGNTEWVMTITGERSESTSDITVDKSGNVFITGYFHDNINISGKVFNTNSSNMFIAKYNTNGILQWATVEGSSNWGSIYGSSCKIDNLGNIIIAGSFEGTRSMGSETIKSVGDQDVFIAKCNSSGQIIWTTTFGSEEGENCRGLSIDLEDNIYVSGSFRAEMLVGTDTLIPISRGCDIFIAKYTPDGDYIWSNKAGGTEEDYVKDMAIYENNLFLTGYFQDQALFGDSVVTAENGLWDSFVLKYNTDGGFEKVSTYNLGSGMFSGLSVTENMDVILSGNYEFTLDIDGDINESVGYKDILILKTNMK